ncbi:hypothetical protein [Streptomyces pluripotens]|uniref:hypothetical protein n=1 Tax=Streptomyces pluripotens TaxID=1355015 RepID=UPI00131E901A|nr:hypothetical protein [Streptomyces pluripotens]
MTPRSWSVADRYRATVARFLERDGLTVRPSAPQTWGLPLPGAEPDVPVRRARRSAARP